MEFSPACALLWNYHPGLRRTPESEDEVLAVSQYLGVDLPEAGLSDRVAFLSNELSNQNRFLSAQLESDAIYDSEEYRKSLFVREIVANNRINRQARMNRDRSGTETR